MKKFYLGLSALVAGPVLAMSIAGCGAAGALSQATNPSFSPIDLLPGGATAQSTIGATPNTTTALSAVGVISPTTQQNLLSDLNGGSITSIEPQVSLSIPGTAGRSTTTGTHVGVVATTQALSAAQAWSIINGSRGLVQGALSGSVTFTTPGNYYFGPADPKQPGVIYGGDLSTLSSIPAGIQITGFDGGNSGQLGADFQSLVTAANGQPINVYVMAYSDSGATTGSVTITGLKISGQAHIRL